MRRLGRLAPIAWSFAMLACGQARDAEPGAAAGRAAGGAADEARAGSGGSTSEQAGRGPGGTAGEPSLAGTGGAIDRGGAPSGGGTPSSGGEGGGNQAGTPAEAVTPDIDTIFETYRTYAPLTPEPVGVSGYIFNLCRLPTLPEDEFLASIHGDGRYLQDWANEAARTGIEARGVPAFPVGAVIVKEKYGGGRSSPTDLVALGIMIKREPGFDAASGDWDYAYYEPALGMVQSAEQSSYCAACHAGASATDYVFVDGFNP